MNLALLPLMVIFDAEMVLWPFEFVYQDIEFPCKKINGKIYDSSYLTRRIKYYHQTPIVLEQLKDANITTALISSRGGVNTTQVNEILNLFGFQDYISYIEVNNPFYPLSIIKIHNETNIPFNEMLYFHYELLEAPNGIITFPGVHSKQLFYDGISMKCLEEGFKEYQTRRKENDSNPSKKSV